MNVHKKLKQQKESQCRTNKNIIINKTRRNSLLEDTQNVLIVEHQVILVVDLDLISAEARDEHSTLSRFAHNLYLSPFFTLQGMRLPFSVYLPGPTAMTYPSRQEKAINLALVTSGHAIFRKENTTNTLQFIPSAKVHTLATGTIFFKRTRSAKGMNLAARDYCVQSPRIIATITNKAE